MQKILIMLLLGLILAGCALLPVHKMDIEQGNIITPEMVSRLHTGMSEEDVREVMGNPVLVNVFDVNRVNYIYTSQLGNDPMVTKKVTLVFNHGRLVEIQ